MFGMFQGVGLGWGPMQRCKVASPKLAMPAIGGRVGFRKLRKTSSHTASHRRLHASQRQPANVWFGAEFGVQEVREKSPGSPGV